MFFFISSSSLSVGIFFILPCIETYTKVDLRTGVFDIPPQEVLTKDSVTVSVDAVVYYRVSNATVSVANVENGNDPTAVRSIVFLQNPFPPFSSSFDSALGPDDPPQHPGHQGPSRDTRRPRDHIGIYAGSLRSTLYWHQNSTISSCSFLPCRTSFAPRRPPPSSPSANRFIEAARLTRPAPSSAINAATLKEKKKRKSTSSSLCPSSPS